jgi:SNF2 family DNA or RNA helicase
MGGYEGRQITGYRNIEALQKKIQDNSMRVLKSECLDLPERIYQKNFFSLTSEQLVFYNEVKKEGIALFNSIKDHETKDPIIIENAMAKVTKMRQIASGYFYDTEENKCIELVPFDKNPRLLRLKEISEEISGKIIIWTVFTRDIELIMKLFGDKAVRYDGKVSQEDREKNKIAFQSDPNVRFFVANISAGAEGLTLNSASHAIYYNNDYSLLKRSQSEARNHRIGSKQSVVYIDLIGNKTFDNKIIKCLRNKQEVANMILKDPLNFFMES